LAQQRAAPRLGQVDVAVGIVGVKTQVAVHDRLSSPHMSPTGRAHGRRPGAQSGQGKILLRLRNSIVSTVDADGREPQAIRGSGWDQAVDRAHGRVSTALELWI
jgi:hypothetical protein